MLLAVLITILLHYASYSRASPILQFESPDSLENPISNIQLKVPFTLSNFDSKYQTNPYPLKDNVRDTEDVNEELDGPDNKIIFMEAVDHERAMFPGNDERHNNGLKRVLSKASNERGSNKKYYTFNLSNAAKKVNKMQPASLRLLNGCVSLLSEENKGRILISDTNYETSLYVCREILNNLKDSYENNIHNRNTVDGKGILKYRDDLEDINRDEVNTNDKCALNCQEVRCFNEDEEATSNNEEIHLSPNKWSRNGYIQWFVPDDGRRNWMVLNEEYPGNPSL